LTSAPTHPLVLHLLAGLESELHSFDPANMTWTQLSAAGGPSARCNHSFTSAGGRLYVHGGSLGSGEAGAKAGVGRYGRSGGLGGGGGGGSLWGRVDVRSAAGFRAEMGFGRAIKWRWSQDGAARQGSRGGEPGPGRGAGERESEGEREREREDEREGGGQG
jgi:hypothetical protein